MAEMGGSPASGPQEPVPVPAAVGRPRKASSRRQKVVLVVLLLVVAGFFAVAWFATRSNGSNAHVGDCLAQSGENSVKIVKCDDPSATFKVVGRVENKTQSEAVIDACDAYQNQGAEQVYWEGKEGEKGLVLCLAKNTK